MTSVKGRHRHVDPPPAANRRPDLPARPAEDVPELLIRFPPRPRPATWPATRQTREQVLERLFAPPFLPDASPNSQAQRRRGLRRTAEPQVRDGPLHRVQRVALLAGAEFYYALALDVFDQTFEDLASQVSAGHLASAEKNCSLDLVAFIQEA